MKGSMSRIKRIKIEMREEITSAGLANEAMRVREAYKVNIDDRAEPKLKESLNEGTEDGSPHNTLHDAVVHSLTAFATPLESFTKSN